MRFPSAGIVPILLATSLAACSGGASSGTQRPVPLPAATTINPTGAQSATISFKIAAPGKGPSSTARRVVSVTRGTVGSRPLYIGATAQTITIAITNGTTAYPPLTATQQCDANGANCNFVASTSLPVVATPYTFTFTSNGNNGALAMGSVSQVITVGANVIAATLSPIPKSASFSTTAVKPMPGGSATQTSPIAITFFDADGNQITDTTPFPSSSQFTIDLLEIDPLGAFSLQPGTMGSATCKAVEHSCTLTSVADTVEVVYNGQLSGLASDPTYFPSEAIVVPASVTTPVTTSNSLDFQTTQCTAPKPICVFAPPFYPQLVATGSQQLASAQTFTENLALTGGSTIYTDAGSIVTGGAVPAYNYANTALASQTVAAVGYDSNNSTAYLVDYTGDGSQSTQLLDTLAPSGTITNLPYPTDTSSDTLNGAEQGSAIITGADGNLWWIDPVTGVARYSNPSSIASANICALNSGSQIFLTASQLVSTPPGVSPARIWFSAVDNINDDTYLGYIDISTGTPTCGSAQSGHYVKIDTDNPGFPSPPNGMAVDGSGNLWYNDADNDPYINIGLASVNANGTPVNTASIPLPGAFSNAEQAYGMSYDAGDGNMYFIADNGLIGKLSATLGLKAAVKGVTQYALPAPLADSYDLAGGPNNADDECVDSPTSGPCVPIFSWDAGSGAAGRLTFVIPAVEGQSTASGLIGNVAVQLDLTSSTVGFTANAKSLRSGRYPAHHANRHGRRPRSFRARPFGPSSF